MGVRRILNVRFFGDLARDPTNDSLLLDAITTAIEREQADLRMLIATPCRPTGTRRSPDMTLGELYDVWKRKTPASGGQGGS